MPFDENITGESMAFIYSVDCGMRLGQGMGDFGAGGRIVGECLAPQPQDVIDIFGGAG